MIPEINGDFFQQLRSFYYVATLENVSQAAASLNRTQAAISCQLQNLERELDAVLFLRIKNRMVLTDEGKKLLEWALKVFEVVTGIQEDVSSSSPTHSGTLRIVSSRPTFRSPSFTKAVYAFHEKWPNASLVLNSGYPLRLCQDVLSGKADFGIGGICRTVKEVDFIPLFSSPIVLVAKKGHGYELDARPTKEQLAKIPYLAFSQNTLTNPEFISFLPPEIDTIMPTKAFISCSNFNIILSYIMQGFGVSMVDMWSVTSLNQLPGILKGVDIYRVDHLVPALPYGIVKRRKSELPRMSKFFIEAFREKIQDLDLEQSLEQICIH